MMGPVLLLAGLLGGVAPEQSVKKDLAGLQGTWIVQSLEYNGQDFSGRYKLSLVIKGDVAAVEGNDAIKKEYTRLKMKLDPSTTPKCLDITIMGGVQNEAVMEGIYEVKGDELKLCIKVLGKDRPGKFESPEGESTALLKLKREP